jgi:hypothetical protein
MPKFGVCARLVLSLALSDVYYTRSPFAGAPGFLIFIRYGHVGADGEF